MRARIVPALTVALAVLAFTACGSSTHQSATPVTVFNLAADPAQNIPTVVAKHPITAAALRSTFDSLLSKHAALVAALAHAVDMGNDTPTAEIKALAQNTQDLTDGIALVYGRPAGRAFAQLWEQHTQFFIDYAQAARTHSGSGKEAARTELRDYQNDFGSFVNTATGGRVPLAAVTDLLHAHVEDLTTYIDADVSGDHAEAAQLLVHAVTHMHVIARAIADAIAAQHLKTVSP